MLAGIIEQENPTHIAVAFDVGRKTFRTELFPDYKAQREAAPEEFRGQVEVVRDILRALGITTLSRENFEADDILATLATEAHEHPEFQVLIVTGDRDYLQLVNDRTTVLYPMKGVSSLHRFTPEAVVEKYGLSPQQYPDFAALRGDPSDNLPKIPGVGEKTAAKWIIQFESLDNLIERADEVGGKIGDKLREHLDQVTLNRTLTQMVTDMDLEVGPADLTFGAVDLQEVTRQFDQLEFGTNLRQRVLAVVATDEAGPAGESAAPAPVAITEPSQPLEQWLQQLSAAAVVIAGSSVALVAEDFSGLHFDCQQLSPSQQQAFSQWCASDAPKYCHGAKSAIHELRALGYDLAGIAHDTAIAAYLLEPGQRTYELPDVYQRHLNKTLTAPSDQLALIADSSLLDAAGAVMELAREMSSLLQEAAAFELYRDLELPLVSILARMEATGIAVDRSVLEAQLEQLSAEVEREEAAARRLAEDESLNLNSPKQLQKVLFETFDMPKTKKTKTGYSTAAKEIEALAVDHPHPFLDHLLAHREYQKLKSTLEGLIKAIASDGRIHTTFHQTVTSTGRLSSSDPNLQNIPVRTEAGRRIRAAFVVSDGYETLLTADYSQIEMRVMAHLSGDDGLIEAYRSGEDLHNYVGSQVFNVPVDKVTPELRRRVKAMSYGLVYGLSAFGLSQQLAIAPAEAKAIMDSYFQRFGGVKRYLDEVVSQARKDGYTATVFGRRRYLRELHSTNRVARENAERAALNAPIQGTAADIIKVAMVRVDAALAGFSSRVLLQVHDELVVEIAPGELEQVSGIVEREMDSAIELSVPLEVSAGTGVNWDAAAH